MEGRGEEVNLGRKGGRPVDPTSPSLPSSTGNAALPPSLLPLKRITLQIPIILATVTIWSKRTFQPIITFETLTLILNCYLWDEGVHDACPAKLNSCQDHLSLLSLLALLLLVVTVHLCMIIIIFNNNIMIIDQKI